MIAKMTDRPHANRGLHLVFVLNSLSTGGAEIHTVGLAKGLSDRGHHAVLVPLLRQGGIDTRGLETEFAEGNRLTSFSELRNLGSLIERHDPDVVISVNGRPAACTRLATTIASTRRRPIVTIYHSTLLHGSRQRIQHAIHLPFINRSDALVYVSANQMAHCSKFFMAGRRDFVIHNGIDHARFNPAARERWRDTTRARLGLTESDYVIGQSAAFRSEKNHLQSIAALARLRALGMSAKLLLIGDGGERARITAAARSADVEDHVIFAGLQADVVPWLSAFDVGILTSVAVETFSLAALEFMALGVPAVLSDIGGASEMVRDGFNGHLFPVNDTDALTKALTAFADPTVRTRAGDAAAARVAEEFTSDSMISKYEVLLRQLVAS